MDKRARRLITVLLVLMTLTAVGVLLGRTVLLRTHVEISPREKTVENVDYGTSELNVITLSPESAARAIASLTRPDRYREEVTVEQFFSGGSTRSQFSCACRREWMRIDRPLSDGRTLSRLSNGETEWVWTNEGGYAHSGPASSFPLDLELGIPVYETLSDLSADEIAEAEMRSMNSETCFYVLTAPDDRGESLACWVGVDSGLLLAAERRRGEEILYRMAVSEHGEPEDEDFELPE